MAEERRTRKLSEVDQFYIEHNLGKMAKDLIASKLGITTGELEDFISTQKTVKEAQSPPVEGFQYPAPATYKNVTFMTPDASSVGEDSTRDLIRSKPQTEDTSRIHIPKRK